MRKVCENMVKVADELMKLKQEKKKTEVKVDDEEEDMEEDGDEPKEGAVIKKKKSKKDGKVAEGDGIEGGAVKSKKKEKAKLDAEFFTLKLRDVPEKSLRVEEVVPEMNTTLLVKNISLKTGDYALFKHFMQCGPMYDVILSETEDYSDPVDPLSVGHAFIQYYRKLDAEKALATLHGTKLDGHWLEVRRPLLDAPNPCPTDARKQKLLRKMSLLIERFPITGTCERCTAIRAEIFSLETKLRRM
ncbi:unnamed protein product [Orchesella dallaii]|uniref:RRM domain-containing protein n=1 Tax=Orchesella dallaii TaxID=48710 RepID=A0ABP1QQN7_9HEXA